MITKSVIIVTLGDFLAEVYLSSKIGTSENKTDINIPVLRNIEPPSGVQHSFEAYVTQDGVDCHRLH
jgi:hypothetical protein